VNYKYDAPIGTEPKEARHAEMLVYVQSTYDVTQKVMKRVREVGKLLGTGEQTRLAVSGNATWPLSWYLRHYPVNWAADVRNVDVPIIIVDAEIKSLDKALEAKYERNSSRSAAGGEPDWGALTLPKLMRWIFTRMSWNGKRLERRGDVRAPRPQAGMTFESIAVNRPGAEGVPGQPDGARAGDPLGIARLRPGQFQEPRGIAIGQDGSVFVVDSKNNRIQKFDAPANSSRLRAARAMAG